MVEILNKFTEIFKSAVPLIFIAAMRGQNITVDETDAYPPGDNFPNIGC